MYTYINIVHTYIYNTYLKLCNENFDRRSPLLLLLLFTRGLSVSTGEAKRERERARDRYKSARDIIAPTASSEREIDRRDGRIHTLYTARARECEGERLWCVCIYTYIRGRENYIIYYTIGARGLQSPPHGGERSLLPLPFSALPRRRPYIYRLYTPRAACVVNEKERKREGEKEGESIYTIPRRRRSLSLPPRKWKNRRSSRIRAR